MSIRQVVFFLLLPLGCLNISPKSYGQELTTSAELPASGTTDAAIIQALTFYRGGDFDAAASKYRDILQLDPRSSDAYVGLTRTLLKQKKVDEARSIVDKGMQTADSPQLRVAAAELDFREGLISKAEREWVDVINSGHKDGRAYLGLARVSTALSLNKRAQTMLEKAFATAPEDPEVRKAWMRKLNRSDRVKFLESYLSGPNPEDPESRAHLQQYLEYLKALPNGPEPACRLVGNVTSTETNMVSLLRDPNHLRGYGLQVSFGSEKSNLLLDTGAGGIVIDRRVAEKAGLKQISANTTGGIGDKGEARAYSALAPDIKVGGLEFENCRVEVIDRRSVVDEDGLIGADVFANFLVNLDFIHHKLRLSQLPVRPGQHDQNLRLIANNDGGTEADEPHRADSSSSETTNNNQGPFDRYIAPEMKDYTQVLRFGHMLLVPTGVNDEKTVRFFLIDSGAFTTQLSLAAAQSVTKVHTDSSMHVRGVSGNVSKVYVADNATLTFARLRQRVEDAVVLNLKDLSDHTGIEVSGIIGFTTMQMLDINIDYRDGLVFMNYPGPHPR